MKSNLFKFLRAQYPNAAISFDRKIRGRILGKPRQIDILIEGALIGPCRYKILVRKRLRDEEKSA